MNCLEFEQIAGELAADKLASVRARVTSLTHAAACQHCGARLEAENILNHGLIALAESTSGEQASVRLRQSLRAAFEAQQEKITAEALAPNVIRWPVHKPVVRRQWTWTLAAAAAAIVFAVAVLAWRNQQAPKNPMIVAGSSPAPTIVSMPSPETIAPENKVDSKLANRNQADEVVKDKRQSQPRRQQPAQVYENDLAANYIPLNYAAGSVTPEESLVVRVDVARTTLIAMGLPLNAESGNEMVKADLRVGIDGVPLAIRLVQQ